MKTSKSKLWLKLLSLILVFGLVVCCFAACSEGSDSDDEDEDENKSTDDEKDDKNDLRDGLVKHEWNGLSFYLSEDLDDSAAGGGDYAMFTDGNITILVSSGEVEFSSSSEFAEGYAEEFEDSYDSVEVKKANGVSHVVSEIGDGTYEVTGLYVKDSYGWAIRVTSYDFEEYGEEMIKYATLGHIDEDFDPEEDDSSSNIPTQAPPVESEPEETEPEETEPEETEPEETEPPVDETYITVHACVPSNWGEPGCWAWLGNPIENVFDTWPGETMSDEGDWYEIEIPGWADYVIINGNDGSVQTEDIAIDPGYDIWIIIDSNGEYYTLYYTEPNASELEAHGY